VEILRRAHIPVVSIGENQSPVSRGRVMLDNFTGARVAMTHLLQQGHRKIVHLSGQVDFGDTIARMRGIEAALGDFGMALDDIKIVNGIFHQEFGYTATAELLASDHDFTAIFAGDDDMAAGVLLALRDGGRRVPEDVSVMGFDDAFHAKHLWPPLTTVRQPVDTLGEAAAELLLKLLANPGSGPLQTIIETSLVVRSSVTVPHQEREDA
jgi:LacI family transcriptional regulator